MCFLNAEKEIDFIVPDEKLTIQVSYSIKDGATYNREVPPLVKYAKAHEDWKCLLITYDEEGKEKGIPVVPVRKWLINALDAGARNITISFEANSLTDVNSFKLSISDDGIGFTEERFKKFSKLMDVDDEDIEHRGLGRLVYLFYFDKVDVDSPSFVTTFFRNSVTTF